MPGAMLDFPDADDYARVRDVFRAAGYTDEAVATTLRDEELPAGMQKRLPVLLARTRAGTPLHTLIRLFVLGAGANPEAVAAALAPMTPAQWVERGLLEAHDGELRATLQVRCYQDLLVAWDFSLETRGVLHPDYVMGISASTLSLAGLTVRRPVDSTLDLGTGSGFQAFMAARHSRRVVAVDKNPRAVQVARFNARLNALDHVECREGDLFAPVVGERFDLIVSNPPFIVSPDNAYFFLHGGMKGDEVCQRIAREAPALLNAGGSCQFLANWAVLRGVDWEERLRSWFADSGCDVWVLRRGEQTVDRYAATWIETGEQRVASDRYAGAFREWMEYYEREGIEAVGAGVITMRRSSTRAPWFRVTEGPSAMSFPSGGDVAQLMDALGALATTDDDALLEWRPAVSDAVRLRREYRIAPGGGWELEAGQLRRIRGLQYEGAIDAYGAELVGRLDGRRTLRSVIDELAAETGVETSAVRDAAIPIVRHLVEQGFLLPGAPGP